MARTDIRIDMNFCDHPKTKRLIRMIGYEGFFALIKLWTSAAKLYPKGILKDCDAFDIADLSGWQGDPDVFVEALTNRKIQFLDISDGQYHIHDWADHQPWVYNAETRSEIARKNIEKRWNDKLHSDHASDESKAIGPEPSSPTTSTDPEPKPSTHELTNGNESVPQSNTEEHTNGNNSEYQPNTECDTNGKDSVYPSYTNGKETVKDLNHIGNTPIPSPIPNPSPNPFPTPSRGKSRESADSPPEAGPIPIDRPLPVKDDDLELYHSLEKAFLSRNGEKFTSWGKEGKAIKEIIKKARIRAPDAYEELIRSMLSRFWELKVSGDKFWRGQPFLPSALNAAGIWDRVLEEFREESSHEMTDEEFEQLVREAAG